MLEPLQLRDVAPSGLLVIVRLGSEILGDKVLLSQSTRTFERWGFFGFSAFEVPGNYWQLLARLQPLILDRPKVLTAEAPKLLDAGFALLPTLNQPHWTVVLSEPTATQFARVRAVFDGPMDNPVWTPRR